MLLLGAGNVLPKEQGVNLPASPNDFAPESVELDWDDHVFEAETKMSLARKAESDPPEHSWRQRDRYRIKYLEAAIEHLKSAIEMLTPAKQERKEAA